MGLDGLQEACDTVLLAEPYWTPKDNEQCIGRVDRRGQKGDVLALIFVAPGSFSERVLVTALNKSHVLLKTLDRN